MPQLCGNSSCPSLILTDANEVFVQGYIPALAETGVLKAPEGETFVKMSRATFEKMARQILAS